MTEAKPTGMNNQPENKLTLEFIRGAIKRAQEAGINTSAIFSELQKALTDQRRVFKTPEEVEKAYERLFNAMKLVIEPYGGLKVEIGRFYDREYDNHTIIILAPHGLFNSNSRGEVHIAPPITLYLYEPMKILYNLISEVTKFAEANKNKIKGMEAALRAYKLMSDDIQNNSLSRSEYSLDNNMKEQLK